MQLFLVFFIFTVAAANFILFDPQLDEHWESFKKTYGKQYHGREEVARRVIWEGRVAEIIHHNLQANIGHFKYTKGINEYSDLSPSEFNKMLNGFKMNNLKNRNGSTWLEPRNIQLPDKVDWRDQGLVTPVKNQKTCGSCWAFSTTGSLEGQQMKKTGQLVSLSEQQLVDCSQPYGNHGCNGGMMNNAFQYIEENHGIDTEESYPYTASDGGPCLFNKDNVGATCTGYVDIPSKDEDALMKAVATIGPISVVIDASQHSFQLYKSGIYDDPNCSNQTFNHAVLVIGYGTENGADYWLVKNSWGSSWGENGYVQMSRNKQNQCGIANFASYPLV